MKRYLKFVIIFTFIVIPFQLIHAKLIEKNEKNFAEISSEGYLFCPINVGLDCTKNQTGSYVFESTNNIYDMYDLEIINRIQDTKTNKIYYKGYHSNQLGTIEVIYLTNFKKNNNEKEKEKKVESEIINEKKVVEIELSSNWDDEEYLKDISLFDRDEDLNSKFKSNLDRELNTRAHMLFRGENDFYTLGLNSNGEKFFGWSNSYDNGSSGRAYILDTTYEKITESACSFDTSIQNIEQVDPDIRSSGIKAEGEFILDCPNKNIITGSWYQYKKKGIFLSYDKSMYGIFVNNSFYSNNKFNLLGTYLLPENTFSEIIANDYHESIELAKSLLKTITSTNDYYVDDLLNRISLASWHYFEELKSFEESKKNIKIVSDTKKLPQNLNPSLSQPPKLKKRVTESQKSAMTMTISEIDLLKQQLHSCLNVNIGAANLKHIKPTIYIKVNPDKTVKSAELVNRERLNDPSFRTAAEAAMRAINNPDCSPLLLPSNKYDAWKEIKFTFDFTWMFD